MHDEEVPGKGDVGRIAEAAFPALVGRAVRFVLGNVFMELQKVLGREATDRALVNFENIDLQFFQRLSDGSSRGAELQDRFLQFTLRTGNLKWRTETLWYHAPSLAVGLGLNLYLGPHLGAQP